LIGQYQDLTFDNLFEYRGLSALEVEEADPKESTMVVSTFTMELVLKQVSGASGDKKDASSNS